MPAPPPEASKPRRLVLDRIPTPIGEALVVVDETGALRAFDFADFEPRMRTLMRRHYGAMELEPGDCPAQVREAVDRYFAGEVDALAELDFKTNGTLFQRRVWAALRTIPAGETLSYKGLAQRIGSPAAVRAVGMANGANPVALVAPCHRVIGADGSLTGYGGGLPRKAWLLAHEGVPAGAWAA
ncbi:MAG TPA: methylated-DNA--[protein]-cysteine S-methyltransferase [Phenylobacterium sp.]|nr:methylated-DNA--[protein]-cysteine S-methyltransferase [Phenylobacterium sp.]